MVVVVVAVVLELAILGAPTTRRGSRAEEVVMELVIDAATEAEDSEATAGLYSPTAPLRRGVRVPGRPLDGAHAAGAGVPRRRAISALSWSCVYFPTGVRTCRAAGGSLRSGPEVGLTTCSKIDG